jgi:hypothetical protein
MLELKQLLQSEISGNCLQEANRITGAAVKEAACRMKPGKSDVSTSYTSDALFNAPDTFFDILALVFRSWLVHGTVSLSLLACAFLPWKIQDQVHLHVWKNEQCAEPSLSATVWS